MLNGIIPINKPKGFTSFDVIAKMRGILRMKKLGHSGTLDPMAEGVLPVFAGSAAKAISLMPHTGKSYTAGFKLGIVTDTQDITGKILSEAKTDISRLQLETAANKFKGEISQIPPMYSAVSVDGKKLYELARKGIEVERGARRITIKSLEILEYDENSSEGKLNVACSSGTYIRTLIHDIGLTLGCGAVMTSLIRTESNGFTLDECVTLGQLEQLRDNNQLESIVIPVERLFCELPEVHLNEKKTVMYKNGVKLHLDRLNGFNGESRLRIFSYKHEFLGLAQTDFEKNELKVLKNLSGENCIHLNTQRTAAALGIFDGIHKGHELILKTALSHTEYAPAVFTFITESIKTKHGKPFEYIYPNRRKLEIFRSNFGFKYIESFNFESLKNISGEKFVKEILKDKMNVGVVICGENFRFGKDASCNVGDLKKFGEMYGFAVEVVNLSGKDTPFSSEMIRDFLRRGDVCGLYKQFDFHYAVTGTVVEGNQLGRTINFPTINQRFETGQIVPKRGVYHSEVQIDGKTYSSVTNVGVRPTVGENTVPIAETHILDFSGNLYGRKITVWLKAFVREERKFGSLDELKNQINADIEHIRENFGKD